MMEKAISQVRALISDVGDPPLLPGGVIEAYLEMNGFLENPDISRVWRSAADALEAIAVSEVLVSKVIKTQDLSTNGAAVADSLRALAAQMRKRADERDAGQGGFSIISGAALRTEAEEWRF